MSIKRQTAADEAHFLMRSLAANGVHGQAIAAHTHSWNQLIFASRGVMTVWTDDGSWVVPPQWAIWAPASVQHGMTFSGATSLRTLYLRPEEWPALPSRSTVICVSDFLRALIIRAVEIGMLDRRDGTHAALALLIVDSLRAHSAVPLNLPLPADATLRTVANDFLREPTGDVSIRQAARYARLGVRTFERRFFEETGMPFGRWQRLARLTEALRQLAAGRSTKDVAEYVGYKSASAFVDAFSQLFGTTPGRYFSDVRFESHPN
jgi:AraC-like DNA-binding protein